MKPISLLDFVMGELQNDVKASGAGLYVAEWLDRLPSMHKG